MEEEGFVRTNGNTGSVIYTNEAILTQIDTELSRGIVAAFVKEAKENGLSFPRVIALISELWES